MTPDLIDWIRAELAARQPDAVPLVDPVLQHARQTWGGDTVYLRQAPQPKTQKVTTRTLQRQRQRPEKSG